MCDPQVIFPILLIWCYPCKLRLRPFFKNFSPSIVKREEDEEEEEEEEEVLYIHVLLLESY